MTELQIGPDWIGKQVENATRPEWGVGKVLRVQKTTVGGQAAHRVSIQFATGHRTVLVPPARLIPPREAPQRDEGWLDTLGKRTADDRLAALPEEVTDVLGTPRARMAAYIPLFEYDDDPQTLVRWARRQAGVGDPLSVWSRDELAAAFVRFCGERDSAFRAAAARFVKAEGIEALRAALGELPGELRGRIRGVLERVI